MATERNDILLRLGSWTAGEGVAEAAPAACGFATPLLSWSLPVGMNQVRFRARIWNAAKPHLRSDTPVVDSARRRFKYFTPIGLDAAAAGHCRALVEIGTSLTAAPQWQSRELDWVYDPAFGWSYDGEPLTLEGIDAGEGEAHEVQVFTTLPPGAPVHTAGGTGPTHTLGFTPDAGRFYAWRWRLAGGAWSPLRAFRRVAGPRPKVSLRDASHDPVSGTTRITLDLAAGRGRHGVGFGWRTAATTDPFEPCALRDSGVTLRDGRHEFDWATAGEGQVGLAEADVDMQATLLSGGVASEFVRPAHRVDNTPTVITGGAGAPANVTGLGVDAGRLGVHRSRDLAPAELPAAGRLLLNAGRPLAEKLPIAAGRYAYPKVSYWGLIEPRNLHEPRGTRGGYGWRARTYADGRTDTVWPFPIWPNFYEGGRSWEEAYAAGDTADAGRVIDTGIDAFCFATPRDDTRPDTLPVPRSTGGDLRLRHLHGWLGDDGLVHAYPDGYDWNRRPAWHRDREVWASGDAWVQAVSWRYTDRRPCPTCLGRNWVASPAGPPYDRLPCPDPDCRGGFDRTRPYLTTFFDPVSGETREGWTMRVYPVATWTRLSRWVSDESLTRIGLLGGRGNAGSIRPKFVHVSGEAILTENEKVGEGLYLMQTRHGPRYLLADRAPFDFTGSGYEGVENRVTRQHLDSTGPVGSMKLVQIGQYDQAIVHAATRSRLAGSLDLRAGLPAVGSLTGGRKVFWLGGADADVPPHADRYDPTQPGSLGVGGVLQAKLTVRDLRFKFLDLLRRWDAAHTMHVEYTASETTYAQIQYRPAGSVGEDDWRDIQTDDTVRHPAVDADLIPPGRFHAIWQTADATLFPDDTDYALRVRTWNLDGAPDASSWVDGGQVSILRAATNPALIREVAILPWEGLARIRFQLRDSQGDAHHLTRAWFSREDPLGGENIWEPIAGGDLYGDLANLEAAADGVGRMHTVHWDYTGYSLGAGSGFRLRLETMPSSVLDNLVLPYFQWLTPRNGRADAAERLLAEVFGQVRTQTFDFDEGTWVALDPPVFEPGLLERLEREQTIIRLHATTDPDAPQGWYTFHTPLPPGSTFEPFLADAGPGATPATGHEVSDPAGLAAWLEAPFAAGQTHGQALAAVADRVYALSLQAQTARQTLLRHERSVRKGLIEQAFFAEDHFELEGDPGVPAGSAAGEVYPARIVADRAETTDLTADPITGDPPTADRYWRFTVQATADGGEAVYEDDVYRPRHVTTLEQVYFRFQFDNFPTFDSQDGRPLRDVLLDAEGNRLAAAAVAASPDDHAEGWDLPAAGGPRDQADAPAAATGEDGDATPGLAVVVDLDGDGETTSAPVAGAGSGVTDPVDVVGILARYRLPPEKLPGAVAGDVLPAGFADPEAADPWEGTYHWRVAAYNRFEAPVLARPRPVVTDIYHGSGVVHVEYDLYGHPELQRGGVDPVSGGGFSGIEISKQDKPGTWEGSGTLRFASGRRAAYDHPSRSAGLLGKSPWVPGGEDRRRPGILWDAPRHRYLAVFDKEGFELDRRLVLAVSFDGETYCEWGQPFGETPGDLPPDTHDRDGWLCTPPDDPGAIELWFVREAGGTRRLMRARAADGLRFGEPEEVAADAGVTPSAAYADDGTLHAWDVADGDLRHAAGPDAAGLSPFTPVTARGDLTGAGVVRLNGQWACYYATEAGEIRSLVSGDGAAWAGDRAEMAAQAIDHAGGTDISTPTAPAPHVRNHLGNDELFLALNFVLPDGTCVAAERMWETGTWQALYVYGIQAAPGELVDAEAGPGGVPHTFQFNRGHAGLAVGQIPRVRIRMPRFFPPRKTVLRQSEWVDLPLAGETASVMDPNPWFFHGLLRGYPYYGRHEAEPLDGLTPTPTDPPEEPQDPDDPIDPDDPLDPIDPDDPIDPGGGGPDKPGHGL